MGEGRESERQRGFVACSLSAVISADDTHTDTHIYTVVISHRENRGAVNGVNCVLRDQCGRLAAMEWSARSGLVMDWFNLDRGK